MSDPDEAKYKDFTRQSLIELCVALTEQIKFERSKCDEALRQAATEVGLLKATNTRLYYEETELRKRIKELEASETKVRSEQEVWPFLRAASAGCISGRIHEWPQLKPAIAWAVERITALESELKNEYLKETKLTRTFCGKDLKYWFGLETEVKEIGDREYSRYCKQLAEMLEMERKKNETV